MAGNKFNSKSFNPQAFGKYIETIPNPRRNELIKSGVFKSNEEIRNVFSSQTGSAYAVLPMYGRIGGEALNYDGQTDITADSSDTYERGVVVYGRAKAWVEKDFSYDITSKVDFMSQIAKQVVEYWADVDQDVLLAILEGIFNMTGAKNLDFVNKHTYDVSEKEDGNMGATTLNTAIQQAGGDNKNSFTLAIMHSAVATNLENMNLLGYLKYTDEFGVQRDLAMATWNGRIVIIDDGMPTEIVPATETEEEYAKYTTYVLGNGAFDFEDIGAKVPHEMGRNPAVNGGEDTLYSRQRKVIAPWGISYARKSQATLSPTNAEFANGQNWTLVNNGEVGAKLKYIDHKFIPISRIISKG